MSTRIYRLWQPGNPQNRVFLPNFWMKLVKPAYPHPPNHVQFIVHPAMTSHDVKEYLTKIYNVPVRDVRLRIRPGNIMLDASHLKPKRNVMGVETSALDVEDTDVWNRVRLPDEKIAYVTMRKDYHFTFPDLFANVEDEIQQQEKQQKRVERYMARRGKAAEEVWQRSGALTWFD